jgi:hypothetical protein
LQLIFSHQNTGNVLSSPRKEKVVLKEKKLSLNYL